ncbi:MAG: hypothetical protein KJ063_07085 [Anaerolineae bacterium]|nr:hypothetical protein [Anaerolineae bacterium]
MSATVSWHPDFATVLLMTITGNATMNDVLDVTEQEGNLIKEAGRVVDTIIDLRAVEGIPNNFLSSVPRIMSMPAANHANSGNKIVVGASGMAEILLNIFSKVGRKLHMFTTMEEAIAFLQERGE